METLVYTVATIAGWGILMASAMLLRRVYRQMMLPLDVWVLANPRPPGSERRLRNATYLIIANVAFALVLFVMLFGNFIVEKELDRLAYKTVLQIHQRQVSGRGLLGR